LLNAAQTTQVTKRGFASRTFPPPLIERGRYFLFPFSFGLDSDFQKETYRLFGTRPPGCLALFLSFLFCPRNIHRFIRSRCYTSPSLSDTPSSFFPSSGAVPAPFTKLIVHLSGPSMSCRSEPLLPPHRATGHSVHSSPMFLSMGFTLRTLLSPKTLSPVRVEFSSSSQARGYCTPLLPRNTAFVPYPRHSFRRAS